MTSADSSCSTKHQRRFARSTKVTGTHPTRWSNSNSRYVGSHIVNSGRWLSQEVIRTTIAESELTCIALGIA